METSPVAVEWSPATAEIHTIEPSRNPTCVRAEHPYAPFPGNTLKWESFVYEDGTRYLQLLRRKDVCRIATLSANFAHSFCSFEGLVRENIPHGKGVMVFGSGTGAGMNVVEPGDKYVMVKECL